jgi:hypothetical protein
MAITKLEYAKKIGELGDHIIKTANEYAEIPQKFKITSLEDVDALKREWLWKTDDFRIIQSEIKSIEIPAGFEKEGNQLKNAYQRYVDYVEEKTMKFSIETMNSGELEIIQKLENEAAQEIKRITNDLANKMFGK